MPPFLIFVLVLAGIWTLSGITTWVNKQKEAERRQRLREQMARAGVNVPIAAPIVSQTPRQISASIAKRFPDVLLPPSLQRPPQKIQQRRPPQSRAFQPRPIQQRTPQRPLRTPAAPPRFVNAAMQRPQQPAQPQPPAPPALVQAPAMLVQRSGTSPVVQSAAKTSAAAPRMTAATLARWLKPATLNQQFLLSEIFQPPLGMRDRGPGM